MDRTGEEMDGLRALADVACAVAEGASGGSAGAARVLGPDLTTPRRVAGGGAEDEGEAFTAGALQLETHPTPVMQPLGREVARDGLR